MLIIATILIVRFVIFAERINVTTLKYFVGQDFSSGAKVTYYNAGKTIEIDDYDVQGFDSSSAGVKQITITYKEIEKTVSVEVLDNNAYQNYITSKLLEKVKASDSNYSVTLDLQNVYEWTTSYVRDGVAYGSSLRMQNEVFYWTCNDNNTEREYWIDESGNLYFKNITNKSIEQYANKIEALKRWATLENQQNVEQIAKNHYSLANYYKSLISKFSTLSVDRVYMFENSLIFSGEGVDWGINYEDFTLGQYIEDENIIRLNDANLTIPEIPNNL